MEKVRETFGKYMADAERKFGELDKERQNLFNFEDQVKQIRAVAEELDELHLEREKMVAMRAKLLQPTEEKIRELEEELRGLLADVLPYYEAKLQQMHNEAAVKHSEGMRMASRYASVAAGPNDMSDMLDALMETVKGTDEEVRHMQDMVATYHGKLSQFEHSLRVRQAQAIADFQQAYLENIAHLR